MRNAFGTTGRLTLAIRGKTAALSAAVAVGLLSVPAAGQSLDDLIRQNEALRQQNATLMDQNEQLIGLILANQARLEAAEERLAGTATAAPPETGDATLSTTPTAGTSAMPTTAAETGQSVLSTQPNMSLTVSGHVNRALLFVDDGTDDGSDNDKQVFNVDNDNSATRFQILGRAEIDESTAVGAIIVAQFESNSTADISQADNKSVSADAELRDRQLELWFEDQGFGRLYLGQGHTASDDSTEIDLSGTGVIAYSGVGDLANGLAFRNSGGSLSGVTIGDVFSNLDGLGRDDRIRYDTPAFRSARLSSSFIDGGDWDLALTYGQDLSAYGLQLAAARRARREIRRHARARAPE